MILGNVFLAPIIARSKRGFNIISFFKKTLIKKKITMLFETNLTEIDWYAKFFEYVNKGYYQKFLIDLSKHYTIAELNQIGKIIRLKHIEQAFISYPQIGKMVLVSDNSTIDCDYFNNIYPKPTRLMVGNHGIYVEFSEMPEEYRVSAIFIKKRKQYNEYSYKGYKLYWQFDTVNYANYKVNHIYISINDFLNTINK